MCFYALAQLSRHDDATTTLCMTYSAVKKTSERSVDRRGQGHDSYGQSFLLDLSREMESTKDLIREEFTTTAVTYHDIMTGIERRSPTMALMSLFAYDPASSARRVRLVTSWP
ncbi:MAG: hypothetical protein HXY34_05810 [Candidatus Thorarchaeota archaeon]|nr:hypothetical protein [Candidatus Thorarchaeota archaeon]